MTGWDGHFLKQFSSIRSLQRWRWPVTVAFHCWQKKHKGFGAVYKSVTRRMIHLGWGLSLKVTMGKKQNSFDKGLLGTRGICAAMHRLQAVLKSHWPLIFKNEVKLSQLGIRTATHCMDTCFNFLRAPCPGARNWTIRTWFTFTGFVGFPPGLKHPTSSTEIKMASFFACGFLDTKTGKSPSLKDLRRFNHIQIIQ